MLALLTVLVISGTPEAAAAFEKGVELFDRATPRGYQDAIAFFEYAAEEDATLVDPAIARITLARWALVDLALPHRDAARRALEKRDLIAARRSLRDAIAIDPYDASLVEQLRELQATILEEARRLVRQGRTDRYVLDLLELHDRALEAFPRRRYIPE